MLAVAAKLGVTSAIAQMIVNSVLKVGELASVLMILGTIASAGTSAILAMGWGSFKTTIKKLAKKSLKRAIAW